MIIWRGDLASLHRFGVFLAYQLLMLKSRFFEWNFMASTAFINLLSIHLKEKEKHLPWIFYTSAESNMIC